MARKPRIHCTAELISRYRGRFSGPLVNRIDLHVEVSRPAACLADSDGSPPEPSAPVCAWVTGTRRVISSLPEW